MREGRRDKQIAKQSDKGRWSVGVKLCWLNEAGKVVAWSFDMNAHDQSFTPLTEPFMGQTIVVADHGFRDQEGIPEHMKLCPIAGMSV